MSLSISDLGGKIIAAVAAASVLGGGTVVLSESRQNAVQQTQIDQHSKDINDATSKLDAVTRELSKTNESLARLLGREEGRRDGK